jgi:hypothetical protein
MALAASSRPGLPGTNVLAYFASSPVTKKKSFITLARDAFNQILANFFSLSVVTVFKLFFFLT